MKEQELIIYLIKKYFKEIDEITGLIEITSFVGDAEKSRDANVSKKREKMELIKDIIEKYINI